MPMFLDKVFYSVNEWICEFYFCIHHSNKQAKLGFKAISPFFLEVLRWFSIEEVEQMVEKYGFFVICFLIIGLGTEVDGRDDEY